MAGGSIVIPPERIDKAILLLRDQKKVLLDRDLAGLYGVPTKALVQAVKRNLVRRQAWDHGLVAQLTHGLPSVSLKAES